MATLMLVDDHPLFRKGLRALIERQPSLSVVAEAGDGDEAVRKYLETRPDITLMDIKLPTISGIQAMEEILALDPNAKVVMLSATDFNDQVLACMRAGAVGYLAKNLEPTELFSTVDLVANTGFSLSKARMAQIMEAMEPGGGTPREKKPPKALSPREQEIVELVETGKTNKEIAALLAISLNTVKVHLGNIMSKLGVRNRVELATYALGRAGGPADEAADSRVGFVSPPC